MQNASRCLWSDVSASIRANTIVCSNTVLHGQTRVQQILFAMDNGFFYALFPQNMISASAFADH